MNNSTPTQFKPLTATFAYYGAFIALGATVSLTGPALPWLAQHTASRLDQISIIFAASSLGYMAGSQLGGRAYDRFPGHRIQAIALLLISLGIAQVPVLHSLWFLSLYEAESRLGGHTDTVDVTLDNLTYPVDTGFLVLNERTYPNLFPTARGSSACRRPAAICRSL